MTPEPPGDIAVVRLADETIDQLAERVADLLDARASGRAEPGTVTNGSGLMSATDVSRWWGVERGWVYQHAEQLGVIRMGTGRRPRLRFDPERVRKAMGDPLTNPNRPAPRSPRARRKPHVGGSRRSTSDSPELLPIHGEQSYGR